MTRRRSEQDAEREEEGRREGTDQETRNNIRRRLQFQISFRQPRGARSGLTSSWQQENNLILSSNQNVIFSVSRCLRCPEPRLLKEPSAKNPPALCNSDPSLLHSTPVQPTLNSHNELSHLKAQLDSLLHRFQLIAFFYIVKLQIQFPVHERQARKKTSCCRL